MNDDRRYYSTLSDKQLLDLFDSYDFYIFEICDELCIRAGLEAEWFYSDGESFESIVDRAYDILKGELDEETN